MTSQSQQDITHAEEKADNRTLLICVPSSVFRKQDGRIKKGGTEVHVIYADTMGKIVKEGALFLCGEPVDQIEYEFIYMGELSSLLINCNCCLEVLEWLCSWEMNNGTQGSSTSNTGLPTPEKGVL